MLLLALILWVGGECWASYFSYEQHGSAGSLLSSQDDYLPNDALGHGSPMVMQYRYNLWGNLEYYLWQMIQDENWEKWILFRKDPRKILPTVAIFNLLKLVTISHLSKKPLLPLSVGKASEIDRIKFQLIQVEEKPMQLGDLSLDYRVARKTKQDFSPLEWFQSELDAIAARPWSWDNFLPRVLFIGGIIVGLLLLVEGCRLVFVRGRRRKKDRVRV